MVCLRNDLEAHSKDQILAFSAMKQTAVDEINTLQAELERMKTKIRQSSKKHNTVSLELTLQLKHVLVGDLLLLTFLCVHNFLAWPFDCSLFTFNAPLLSLPRC